jgi:hypothetical protein
MSDPAKGVVRRQPEKIIYQGDDADRLTELTRALDVAEAAAKSNVGAARLGDALPSVEEARKALEDFVSEAAERAFVVKFQHIGSRRFRDFVLAHPPRKVDGEPDEAGVVRQVDHPDDWLGVNMDTAVPRCCCTATTWSAPSWSPTCPSSTCGG